MKKIKVTKVTPVERVETEKAQELELEALFPSAISCKATVKTVEITGLQVRNESDVPAKNFCLSVSFLTGIDRRTSKQVLGIVEIIESQSTVAIEILEVELPAEAQESSDDWLIEIWADNLLLSKNLLQ